MEKFVAWLAPIHFMVIVEACSYNELEMLVGCLNHVYFIILLA
jgi:hypothetical protein